MDTVICPVCKAPVEVEEDDMMGDVYAEHPKDPRHPRSGLVCPTSGQAVGMTGVPTD